MKKKSACGFNAWRHLEAFERDVAELVAEYQKLDSGIGEYTDGVAKLYDGFSEICGGARELAEGGILLSDGTKELVQGTAELRQKTAVFGGNSSEKLTEMLDNMTGQYNAVSFVSAKNSEISSVQFVIKTESVEIPEPEKPAEKPAEKLNFGQKLLRLFGLY